ncbi:hypothetical protein PACTADRAFT_676 [Pachysolen tannophilus NRRL Y-2460]|uniref:Uncharacterized protein n=1 Tax=Pachysolen tannophilus NRRL Y-2460 TaxID=669874 RepID=A0A1E4U2H0_PACTA|nr:hypothetical protein PACTADRAFT_676 [Pachysolen tannophilus NRRL Y-2460]
MIMILVPRLGFCGVTAFAGTKRSLFTINQSRFINTSRLLSTDNKIHKPLILRRCYAKLGNDNDVKAIELYYKVTTNPRISKALEDIMDLINNKGFLSPNLSPFEQINFINDKDVQMKMNNFTKILKEEKINFDLNVLNDFIKFFHRR